jgi:hypothetical protein
MIRLDTMAPLIRNKAPTSNLAPVRRQALANRLVSVGRLAFPNTLAIGQFVVCEDFTISTE